MTLSSEFPYDEDEDELEDEDSFSSNERTTLFANSDSIFTDNRLFISRSVVCFLILEVASIS